MEDEPDRSILWDSLLTFFENDAKEIWSNPEAFSKHQKIPGPVWNSLNGCWHFYHKGILIGVEKDGYAHS